MEQSNLKLALFDASVLLSSPPPLFPIDALDTNTLSLIDKDTLVLFTKCDLVLNTYKHMSYTSLHSHLSTSINFPVKPLKIVCVSCEKNEGVSELIQVLSSHVSSSIGERKEENPVITRERHRAHLQECAGHLTSFLSVMNANTPDLVLAAEHLRQVHTHDASALALFPTLSPLFLFL